MCSVVLCNATSDGRLYGLIGYPWISLDTFGNPWTFLDIPGYSKTSLDVEQFTQPVLKRQDRTNS